MITLLNIAKSFQKREVLSDISLNIEPHSISVIIGPNGSGKTTLIKIILGLVKPDCGIVRIGSHQLNDEYAYRERIGYMPQQANFPGNLTGQEVLEMVKDLRRARILDEELLEKFNFKNELGKPIRNLSGGTRQKLNAVVAFLFDPDILILDEPTAGLDPLASGILKEKIRRAQKRGKTIILTSHLINELEHLSENVLFMLEGKVRYHGPIHNLVTSYGETRLENAIVHLMNGGMV